MTTSVRVHEIKIYSVTQALNDSGYMESLTHTQLKMVEAIDSAYKRFIEKGNGFDGGEEAFNLLMENNTSVGAILDNVGLLHKNLGFMLIDAGKSIEPRDSDDSDCFNLLFLIVQAMMWNASLGDENSDTDNEGGNQDGDGGGDE